MGHFWRKKWGCSSDSCNTTGNATRVLLHLSRDRGGVWEGKKGSICHFAFSLVLQCLGIPRYPDAGKNSTKSVIVTPLFVCPKC